MIARDISPTVMVLLRSVGGKPDGGSRTSSETLGNTREKSRQFWIEGWSDSELTSVALVIDGCEDSY